MATKTILNYSCGTWPRPRSCRRFRVIDRAQQRGVRTFSCVEDALHAMELRFRREVDPFARACCTARRAHNSVLFPDEVTVDVIRFGKKTNEEDRK